VDKKINNLQNKAKIEKNIINSLFFQTAVWVGGEEVEKIMDVSIEKKKK
jgi:hypothetical protein